MEYADIKFVPAASLKTNVSIHQAVIVLSNTETLFIFINAYMHTCMCVYVCLHMKVHA